MVPVVQVVLFCITGFVVHHAGIFLHELGHIAAALLCGWKPLVLKVGAGRVRSSFRVGDLEFRWTAAPCSGFAQAFTANLRFFRLKRIVFALAGPVVTAGVIAGICVVLESEQGNLPSWLLAALQVSLLIEVGMLFFSVWPAWVNIDGHRVPNDMLQVYKSLIMSKREVGDEVSAHIFGAAMIFIERGENDRAKQLLEHFKDASENVCSVDLEVLWIHLLRTVGRKDEAQAIIQSVIDGRTEFKQSRAEALDALACLPLFYGHADLLEEGLRLIDRAIAESPDAITLKGTKGSLLIELGLVDEGFRLIEQVAAETKSQNDLAIVGYYRALAYAKRGDPGKAQEVLQNAFRQHPECIVRRRVAALVWDESAKAAEKVNVAK